MPTGCFHTRPDHHRNLRGIGLRGDNTGVRVYPPARLRPVRSGQWRVAGSVTIRGMSAWEGSRFGSLVNCTGARSAAQRARVQASRGQAARRRMRARTGSCPDKNRQTTSSIDADRSRAIPRRGPLALDLIFVERGPIAARDADDEGARSLHLPIGERLCGCPEL